MILEKMAADAAPNQNQANNLDRSKTREDQGRTNEATEEARVEAREKVIIDQSIASVELSVLRALREAGSKGVKILWILLFSFGLAICTWQICKTIINYINSPVVTTYTITTAAEMNFPIIYICPTSWIHKDYLNRTPSAEHQLLKLKSDMTRVWDYIDFLASGNISEPFESRNPSLQESLAPLAFQNMTLAAAKARKNSRRDISDDEETDPEEFFKNATVSLDWHLRYCQFRHFLYENFKTCRNISREVFDPDYGKCYVVDVGNRTQAVQSSALYVVFNVQSRWFPQNSSLTPIFNGFVVNIENDYNVRGSGEKVFVTPSTYNRIDLAKQKQQFKSFERPCVQKCTDPNDFLFEIFNVNYTQRSCDYDCVARALKKNCNCLPPIDRSLYQESVLNDTRAFCMNRHIACIKEKVHRNFDAQKKIDQCRDRCHVSCSGWKYDVRASSMDLYKPAMAGMPMQDLAYLFIAFRGMEYTQVSQDNSKTPDDFISQLGAQLNLWLGASMITAFQLPITAVILCGLCCYDKVKIAALRRTVPT